MRNVPSIEGGGPAQGGGWGRAGGLEGLRRHPRRPLGCGNAAAASCPGRRRGSRPRGARPAQEARGPVESGQANLALGCIVVKAPEVLQRRLVAELVFILWGGGSGGGPPSAPLQPPRAPHHTAELCPSTLYLCWALPVLSWPAGSYLSLWTQPCGHPCLL